MLIAPILLIIAGLTSFLSVSTHPATAHTHADVIVVLGSPANPDGTAAAEQRERVLAAVAEFRRGHAAHLLLTGGAAHNDFVESDVMADLAEHAGVSANAILCDRHSRNTVENLVAASQILRDQGWNSMELVSSPSHLPRAALLAGRLPFSWNTYASAWPPEYQLRTVVAHYSREIVATALLRWIGTYPSRAMPGRDVELSRPKMLSHGEHALSQQPDDTTCHFSAVAN